MAVQPKTKLLYVTPEKLAKSSELTAALEGLASRCDGPKTKKTFDESMPRGRQAPKRELCNRPKLLLGGCRAWFVQCLHFHSLVVLEYDTYLPAWGRVSLCREFRTSVVVFTFALSLGERSMPAVAHTLESSWEVWLPPE